MASPLAQRLLLLALAAVFGVLSTIPRAGSRTLHLATGDHLHFSFGDGDNHRHDHGDEGLAHSHDFHHDHPAGDAVGGPAACDVHRHGCVEIGLPSGDYKKSAAPAALGLDQAWALLPLPPGVANAVTVIDPHPERGRPPGLLGLTPPDLVRSTVLLI